MAATQVLFIPPNAPCIDCKSPVLLDPGTPVTRDLLRATRCSKCVEVRRAFEGPLARGGRGLKNWEILIPETPHGRRPRWGRGAAHFYILIKFRRIPTTTTLGSQWFYRHHVVLDTKDHQEAVGLAEKTYLYLAERYQGRCGPIKRLKVKPELLRPEGGDDDGDKNPDRCIYIYRANVAGYKKKVITRYRVRTHRGHARRGITTIEKAREIRDRLEELGREVPRICYLCKRPPVWEASGGLKRAVLKHLHDDCPNQFMMSSTDILTGMKVKVWNKLFSKGRRQHFGKKPIGPKDLYWLGMFSEDRTLLREEDVFYEAHDGHDIHRPRLAEPVNLDDFEV